MGMSAKSKKFGKDLMAAASAVRTVSTLQNGLQELAAALDNGLSEPFERAIDLLGSINGRVIITGVGKSGHVGSKVAATLASTGTPAYFVHPAEANHGDLGMITAEDAIIAISWSGETTELKGIVAYAERFSIPMIAITAGEKSALAKAAEVILKLPRAPEACPHGLAPTTSAMLQLATGDALAVALLESRGFTADHFRTFHPGGQLGANLTQVADLMHTGDSVPLVPLGTPMTEAVQTLTEKRFGCVGIVDGQGFLAGIITDGDLARNLSRDISGMTVDELMTADPKTIAGETYAGAAMELLNRFKVSALIVTRDKVPVGIIHFHDLLRAGVA